MEHRDFFISYNKANKDWAKWVGGTLEEYGYSVYLQAWDITPGDDFIARMNEFLKYSKNYIAIWSKAFSESPYCKIELQTAFDKFLNKEIQLFLIIRAENIPVEPLYQTTVYVDLFDLNKEFAEKALLNGVGYTKNPRKKGSFPNAADYPMATKDVAISGQDAFNESSANKVLLPRAVHLRDIVVIESNHNKKGDLFNQLIYDVFHALGFANPNFNAQKTGREIDMLLKHRTENRIAVVESKATEEKIGGTDINKFYGAFDVERSRYEQDGCSVVGYFVSKSGFTSTALDQERERASLKSRQVGQSSIVLLGPDEIIQQLIQGNVLCSLEHAANAVHSSETNNLFLCDKADLLVCEYGWIWVLYYSEHPRQAATHFAFVHADGNQLVSTVAKVLCEKAKADTRFAKLQYLACTLPNMKESTQEMMAVQEAYYQYLASELGVMQFEGMPADKDAGAIKVNLENIFVPLMFNYQDEKKDPIDRTLQEVTIRDILSRTHRAAILAKPGGGKSTLIRRIALAYAYPERRAKVDDDLPDQNWFPVYIRCRDIGEDAKNSISQIIIDLVHRAELSRYEDSFRRLVENALQDGRVLLLIDGLDEISAEQQRIRFVAQLRTFVTTYPTAHLLITSRETGFRSVAKVIASYCEQYSVARFNNSQIRSLSLKWHTAILGSSVQAEQEADKACNIILKDPRIVALARNPLLLTTLLFVKRWVGYLPTKKCTLYEEMIKLLLVTWNAAAHDRLDLDETEPQLAFVAHHMTTLGQQKITRSSLEKCIIEARRALPELLGYTTVSPSNFIDQVEERSSLLIRQGLEEDERGKLVPSYEFSHLSFQEYLTAKAISESWLPESADQDLKSLLENHMDETQWTEVVPLAAVLLGLKAKPVIRFLMDCCQEYTEKGLDVANSTAALHLANCIASEISIEPGSLDRAIRLVIKNRDAVKRRQFRHDTVDVFETILNSKFGSRYKEVVKNDLFFDLDKEHIHEYSDEWIRIYRKESDSQDLSRFAELLGKEKREDYITGALLMMEYAYNTWGGKKKRRIISENELYMQIFSRILELLQKNDTLTIFSAAWCIAWSGYDRSNLIPNVMVTKLANCLIKLWLRNNGPAQFRRIISWSISSICTPALEIHSTPALQRAILTNLDSKENEFDSLAATYLGILIKMWNNEEVSSQILPRLSERHNSFRFLKAMGFADSLKDANLTF